jgi:hypothetical protein
MINESLDTTAMDTFTPRRLWSWSRTKTPLVVGAAFATLTLEERMDQRKRIPYIFELREQTPNGSHLLEAGWNGRLEAFVMDIAVSDPIRC